MDGRTAADGCRDVHQQKHGVKSPVWDEVAIRAIDGQAEGQAGRLTHGVNSIMPGHFAISDAVIVKSAQSILVYKRLLFPVTILNSCDYSQQFSLGMNGIMPS